MDAFTPTATTAPFPAPVLRERPAPPPADEEVPLGWECAHPALQIERWCAQDERRG